MVVSNLYASCQDPSVYQDPEVFKPDRFLDSDGCFKKPDKKYMNPFGTGRFASYLSESLISYILWNIWVATTARECVCILVCNFLFENIVN